MLSEKCKKQWNIVLQKCFSNEKSWFLHTEWLLHLKKGSLFICVRTILPYIESSQEFRVSPCNSSVTQAHFRKAAFAFLWNSHQFRSVQEFHRTLCKNTRNDISKASDRQNTQHSKTKTWAHRQMICTSADGQPISKLTGGEACKMEPITSMQWSWWRSPTRDWLVCNQRMPQTRLIGSNK